VRVRPASPAVLGGISGIGQARLQKYGRVLLERVGGDQVRKTKRPMILTQNGRSAAVLLDVAVYEDPLDEVALLRDVRTGEEQVAAREGTAHRTVTKRLRVRLVK
jgi:prevent-host-death family protein